ncbi:MAG: glycosyltransferase [bacterium]
MRTETTGEPRGCAIVPAYREVGRIGAVVRAIREMIDDVIVVDDGSPDDTGREAESAGAVVIRHAVNLGKGAAGTAIQCMNLMLGFDETTGLEFTGLHPV